MQYGKDSSKAQVTYSLPITSANRYKLFQYSSRYFSTKVKFDLKHALRSQMQRKSSGMMCNL